MAEKIDRDAFNEIVEELIAHGRICHDVAQAFISSYFFVLNEDSYFTQFLINFMLENTNPDLILTYRIIHEIPENQNMFFSVLLNWATNNEDILIFVGAHFLGKLRNGERNLIEAVLNDLIPIMENKNSQIILKICNEIKNCLK